MQDVGTHRQKAVEDASHGAVAVHVDPTAGIVDPLTVSTTGVAAPSAGAGATDSWSDLCGDPPEYIGGGEAYWAWVLCMSDLGYSNDEIAEIYAETWG